MDKIFDLVLIKSINTINSIGLLITYVFKALTITGRRVVVGLRCMTKIIILKNSSNQTYLHRILNDCSIRFKLSKDFGILKLLSTSHNTRLASPINSGVKHNNLDLAKFTGSKNLRRCSGCPWDCPSVCHGNLAHTEKILSDSSKGHYQPELLSDQKQEPRFYCTIHLTETSSQL